MALSETSHAEDLAFAIKVPALDNTFGALLLGTFLGLVYVHFAFQTSQSHRSCPMRRLYGLTLHQGYRYTRFPAYDKDSKYIKCTASFPDGRYAPVRRLHLRLGGRRTVGGHVGMFLRVFVDSLRWPVSILETLHSALALHVW